jgi:hypothetical protein
VVCWNAIVACYVISDLILEMYSKESGMPLSSVSDCFLNSIGILHVPVTCVKEMCTLSLIASFIQNDWNTHPV